jgi:hypothetical protein
MLVNVVLLVSTANAVFISKGFKMAKNKKKKLTDHKSIITIIGTDAEQEAMHKLKSEAAGGLPLSFGDFILRKFGVRK